MYAVLDELRKARAHNKHDYPVLLLVSFYKQYKQLSNISYYKPLRQGISIVFHYPAMSMDYETLGPEQALLKLQILSCPMEYETV